MKGPDRNYFLFYRLSDWEGAGLVARGHETLALLASLPGSHEWRQPRPWRRWRPWERDWEPAARIAELPPTPSLHHLPAPENGDTALRSSRQTVRNQNVWDRIKISLESDVFTNILVDIFKIHLPLTLKTTIHFIKC